MNQQAMPSVVAGANIAGVGIEHVDAVDLHPHLASAIVEDLHVGLAEHDEQVALPGVLQLVRHVQVGIHARLQDREAAELAQFRGMGVEVEGAGDQHVEARIDRLARGGDEVRPADGAVFGTDQDRGATFGAVLAFDEACRWRR